jgi:hypothetical protein
LPGTHPGADLRHEENRNILILFSLVPSTPAYRVIVDGIRQNLTEAFGEGYNLHMEYLETERYPKGNYPKERFDLYNTKYRYVRLDLLICVGIDIISTIKQLAEPYLLQLPAISIDYDFSAFGYRPDISLNDCTAVFPIKPDPAGTIATALELFPRTKSVYVISGISTSYRIFYSVTKDVVKKFGENRTFIFLSEISMDDALQTVRHLPGHSIIIVASFNTDSKNVPYYNPESIRLISKAANAPVFAYSDMGLGDGAVGGYIFSFRKIGLRVGKTAVSILKGTDPRVFNITEKDIYEHLFDLRELKRWNIADSDKIPEGSIILYKEMSFLGRYRLIIIAGITFLILQTLLIVSLVIMIKRQKKITRRLKEAENRYRELIHEDRVLCLLSAPLLTTTT